MDIHVAENAADASVVAAEWLARQLRNAVRRRGTASMAVSGGSTAPPMFAALAEIDVPWKAVSVWQVDERVAPDGDSGRNAGQLDALPIPPKQVKMMPVTAKDLGAAAKRYAAGLPERFDVVHLGMGDDGHTASWAPGDPVIDDPRPVALCGLFNGFLRMTLTPSVVTPGASSSTWMAWSSCHTASGRAGAATGVKSPSSSRSNSVPMGVRAAKALRGEQVAWVMFGSPVRWFLGWFGRRE